jgi:hypothetical protein
MTNEPEPMTTDPNGVDDPEPADPHHGPLDNPDDERFLEKDDPRRHRKILHPDQTDDPPDAG